MQLRAGDALLLLSQAKLRPQHYLLIARIAIRFDA